MAMYQSTDFDIERHLRIRFPEFFHLLSNNPIPWRKVNKVYANQAAVYGERLERTGSTFPIEASLYNIIMLTLQGDAEAGRNFDYIKQLFTELQGSLSAYERKEIVPALYGMLTNVNMAFRNFLGELSVLNLLKRQAYTLLKTERPLIPSEPKGIKIDFHLRQEKTKKEYLVEIVNFRLDNDNTASADAITAVLEEKIVGKLLDTGILRSNKFYLYPVVWGNWEYILRLLAYYQTVKPRFTNTTAPLALVPFTTETGELVHIFGTIDTIFVRPGGIKFTTSDEPMEVIDNCF
jgi:hypothetical protein